MNISWIDTDVIQMQDKKITHTSKQASKQAQMIQKQTRYCPCQAVNQ